MGIVLGVLLHKKCGEMCENPNILGNVIEHIRRRVNVNLE